MIDHYFDQYEKIIQPLKHLLSSGKNCSSKQSNIIISDNSTRDLTNRKEITIPQDDLKAQIIAERKKYMFLRKENIDLKRSIETIREEKRKLVLEINQLKKNKETEGEYVLRLENLANHLKNNLSKTKTKTVTYTEPSMPMSLSGRNNNNTNYNIKNNNIKTYQPYQNQSPNQNILQNEKSNSAINKLEFENKKLIRFKEGIIELSKNYDDYNDSIVQSIVKFGEMIKEINAKCESDHPIESIIELQCFNEGKQSIDDVLLIMIKYMQTKQDEYNFLLNEKETDSRDITNQYKELEEQYAIMDDIIRKQSNEIEEMKTQLSSIQESTHTYTQNKRKTINCIHTSSSQGNINSKLSMKLPPKNQSGT